MAFRIDPATPADVPLILDLVRELAEYERLADEVVATEADIHAALFAERPAAETVLGRLDGETVGFALFFGNSARRAKARTAGGLGRSLV